MEPEIIQSLKDLGYNGPLLDNAIFNKAVEEGPKNIEYTKCVNFLTNELRSLCNIDEEVNALSTPEDSVSFLMELSSFLKELGCPYQSLVTGHISDRLDSKQDKVLLLDYLTAELMSARMIHHNKPDNKIELKLQESRQASHLKKMLMTLCFPKPPANISVQSLFQKLHPVVDKVVKKANGELLGTPACNFAFTPQQWDQLQDIQTDMHKEYTIRREMLLQRLDCTVQSFNWSDKVKGKEGDIDRVFSEKRRQLRVEPDVTMADLISARTDLAIIEKTSSASVRKNTKTKVNQVRIGPVPDRGGRANEQPAPAKEMPSWQQRQSGPPGGGGGRGRGGGRGDNRSNSARGGYGGGNNTLSSGSFQQSGGNYQNKNNNYQSGSGNSHSKVNYTTYGGTYSKGGGGTLSSSSSYQSSSQNNYQSSTNYATYGGTYSSKSGEGNTSGYHSGGGNKYENSSRRYDNYKNSNSTGKHGGGNYSQNFDSAGYYGGGRNRDSGGSYDYQTEPKRPKTYESFQSNKTTYADQYVQESQHNQQYQSRGRSNYNRGGRGGRY